MIVVTEMELDKFGKYIVVDYSDCLNSSRVDYYSLINEYPKSFFSTLEDALKYVDFVKPKRWGIWCINNMYEKELVCFSEKVLPLVRLAEKYFREQSKKKIRDKVTRANPDFLWSPLDGSFSVSLGQTTTLSAAHTAGVTQIEQAELLTNPPSLLIDDNNNTSHETNTN